VIARILYCWPPCSFLLVRNGIGVSTLTLNIPYVSKAISWFVSCFLLWAIAQGDESSPRAPLRDVWLSNAANSPAAGLADVGRTHCLPMAPRWRSTGEALWGARRHLKLRRCVGGEDTNIVPLYLRNPDNRFRIDLDIPPLDTRAASTSDTLQLSINLSIDRLSFGLPLVYIGNDDPSASGPILYGRAAKALSRGAPIATCPGPVTPRGAKSCRYSFSECWPAAFLAVLLYCSAVGELDNGPSEFKLELSSMAA
jgi:hypothetical protein